MHTGHYEKDAFRYSATIKKEWKRGIKQEEGRARKRGRKKRKEAVRARFEGTCMKVTVLILPFR